MDEIKEVVKKVIGDLSEKNPDQQNVIQNQWDQILNPQELMHTRISELKKNQLIVNVDSSVWLY